MDDEIYLRTQHLAAINLVCLVAALIIHRRRCNRRRSIDPEMMLHNQKVRQEILHNLATSGKCRKLIRMSENAFMILCHKLKNECGLQATQRMCVEEQVLRFLHIVGHDLRTSHVSWLYRRLESATNRHFHRVLNAIILLEDECIQQPTGDLVPKEIQEKKRFYPFFKDCIGAIDGTHVRVRDMLEEMMTTID